MYVCACVCMEGKQRRGRGSLSLHSFLDRVHAYMLSATGEHWSGNQTHHLKIVYKLEQED